MRSYLTVFFILLFTVVALMSWHDQIMYGILYQVPRDPAADKLCNDATIWFHIAEKQFLKWREARPLLHVGQSVYARSLVQEMIVAYRLRLIFDKELDRRPLLELYRLLGDLPPSQDPPATNKPLSGGLLFIVVDEQTI